MSTLFAFVAVDVIMILSRLILTESLYRSLNFNLSNKVIMVISNILWEDS